MSGRTNKSYEEYSKMAMDRVESILNTLKIEYSTQKNGIIEIKCPVHSSSSVGNSIIYKNTGVWLCFSGNCHCSYGKNIMGLIKGTLDKANLPCSWDDVFNVIEGEHVIVPIVNSPQEAVDIFKDERSKPETIIPSKYFLKRGYSEKSLIKFEVGDCVRGPYANRAIVPVRYINGEYMGFSARIHWDECKTCGYYHSKYETCLSKDHDFHFMYRKWYHSKGLQKSKTLYGIHKVPVGTKKVALVEGPGCVWKLDDYGILAVAALGKDFSNLRLQILKNIGVEKVLLLPDNDAAGKEFRDRFVNDYHSKLDIFMPNLTKKDVSEMGDEDIKKYILNKWEKI